MYKYWKESESDSKINPQINCKFQSRHDFYYYSNMLQAKRNLIVEIHQVNYKSKSTYSEKPYKVYTTTTSVIMNDPCIDNHAISNLKFRNKNRDNNEGLIMKAPKSLPNLTLNPDKHSVKLNLKVSNSNLKLERNNREKSRKDARLTEPLGASIILHRPSTSSAHGITQKLFEVKSIGNEIALSTSRKGKEQSITLDVDAHHIEFKPIPNFRPITSQDKIFQKYYNYNQSVHQTLVYVSGILTLVPVILIGVFITVFHRFPLGLAILNLFLKAEKDDSKPAYLDNQEDIEKVISNETCRKDKSSSAVVSKTTSQVVKNDVSIIPKDKMKSFAQRWMIKPNHNLLKMHFKVPFADLPKDYNSGKWEHGFIELSSCSIHRVSLNDHPLKYQKELVLFIHGFPENWYSWRHQMSHLAEKYHVIAIDLPGFGMSSKPQNSDFYTQESMHQWMKELIGRLGHNKCHLVVHDWGGILGWSFAERYPDCFNSLTLINTLNPKQFKQNITISQFFKSYYMYFQQLPFLPTWFAGLDDALWIRELFRNTSDSLDISTMDIFRREMLNPEIRNAVVLYYQSLFSSVSGWGSVATCPSQKSFDIKLKVLVIWGAKDPVLENSVCLRSLQQNQNNSNTIRFVELENSGHFPHQDEPNRVNAILEKWLEQSL